MHHSGVRDNYPQWYLLINSLWPSDAIWRQKSKSTLLQEMALPEPMLTLLAAFAREEFHSKFPSYYSARWVWRLYFEIYCHIFQGKISSFHKSWAETWLLLLAHTRISLQPQESVRQGLTHWGRNEIDAISQTTFSNAFSCMKMFEFRLKFHWSLFLRVQLTIFQHWFR